MRALRAPARIIRADLRAYLFLNVMAYGLLVLGLAVGVMFPDLNAVRRGALDGDGTTDQVVSLLATPWLFALTIFFVNISRLALASILLPSLAVPLSRQDAGHGHRATAARSWRAAVPDTLRT